MLTILPDFIASFKLNKTDSILTKNRLFFFIIEKN